ncbi:alanine--glyoxylate aminotransferase family protein [Acerihabitans sp. TG2]|uniref:pyridoxamine--pyruvate transaminase n=1 Tax=Acerihabitans sp. TG2 TaxID=3096008 RepID=UPI002B236E82|nr:alanine--glyoxylate aminotransferase family protein [Acerihabitans sp. TG2]MEA9391255.1 alanine--glyoxylate aminotransferase family protein [Acerihabitans sp. TG2]
MTAPILTEAIFTLTTGPVNAYPDVMRALSMPIMYDYDPYFLQHYQHVCQKVHSIMHTQEMPLILHGEPVLGLEAAAASLIGRDDVVLNLVSGVYGAGFGEWARRYCKELLEIRVPYDQVVDATMVEEILRLRPDIGIVCVCHHDTPSGTLNPVVEIGHVVQQHGALFLVDAVSSFGGMPITPAMAHADVFVTGPNKCLGCPPSLSLVAVNHAAWEKIASNPSAPRDSILSLLDWRYAWQCDHPFPFTPSVAEINGLNAALDRYLAEGETQVWARHALTAQACRAGLKAMGLSLWAADEAFASPTATAVNVPPGIDEAQLRATARARFGVVFSAGKGETLGKLTRIGHMGPTAQPMYAVLALAAYGGAVNALSTTQLDIGAGIAAAMAIIGSDRTPVV